MRLHADDGLWCSFLLPVAFFINYLKEDVHNSHETNFILCILSFGTLIIIFENKLHLFTNQVPKLPVLKHSYLLLIAFCTIVLLHRTVCNLGFLLFITFVTAWVFSYMYHLLLVKCPRSFTFGEAAIVAQGTTLFIISCSLSWYNNIYEAGDDFKDISVESKFLQILIIGSASLIWIQYMKKCLRSIYPFYATCVVLGLMMYGLWIIALNQDPILWFLSICVKSKIRIMLMCFWVFLTIASMLFVIHQNLNEKQKASTKNRKYFHIIIIFIFLPGSFLDPEFLYVASVGTFCVFVVLEMFRILAISPLGPLIQNSFLLFLDEKDSGLLILTHIYLLIGCSCPLWLHTGKFDSTSFHISLLSGVISVGIGDTIAAVAGSHFGKHKWPGSEKTFEGTFFAILAQVVFAVPVLFFKGLNVWWNLPILLTAIVFTSVLEANTSQVDNLVLPLFMYPLLCIIQ